MEGNIYYKRALLDYELLYVSRAQQRIIDLSVHLAEGLSTNNVTSLDAQLIVELQYSIEVLYSTDLVWSPDDIRMMIDYYTVYADLVVYPFRSISFSPVCYTATGQVWATIPQLNAVSTASIARDNALQAAIAAEAQARANADSALWDAISDSGQSAVLGSELTSEVSVGGIIIGDVFVQGTKLADLWAALLSKPAKVLNLMVDSYQEIFTVGDSITVSQVTWDVEGSPKNLKLSDNVGILTNVSVTGGAYTPSAPLDYPNNTNQKIVWTLSGDGIEDITLEVNSYWPSYYGAKTTSSDTIITLTESEILAESNVTVDTSEEITVSVYTNSNQQGWIAVHEGQTGNNYDKWKVTEPNSGYIQSGMNFIQYPVTVLVDGESYNVYTWGYRSPLTLPITLYKSYGEEYED
jgi:hypothetical protein